MNTERGLAEGIVHLNSLLERKKLGHNEGWREESETYLKPQSLLVAEQDRNQGFLASPGSSFLPCVHHAVHFSFRAVYHRHA